MNLTERASLIGVTVGVILHKYRDVSFEFNTYPKAYELIVNDYGMEYRCFVTPMELLSLPDRQSAMIAFGRELSRRVELEFKVAWSG